MKTLVSKTLKKWKSLWSDAEDTGSAVARGATLLFATRMTIKFLQFIRTVILARLLFPNDFGLFGMAVVSLGLVDTFFQPGLNSALVREKGNVYEYLNSAWTMAVLRNTILLAAIFFLAPLVGLFFHNETIVPFVRVLALAPFIAGFENIGAVLFQKEMQFNKNFQFLVSIVLLEVIFVVVAAFFLRSAWALVFAAVAYRLFGTILSYIFHPYRPKFEWNMKRIRHLFSYGKWMWAMSIIGYFVSQGDNITVGKMLTPSDLGFYQAAFALALLPSGEIARSFGNILFPLFSRIGHDKEFLKRSFVRVARIIFAVTIPASFGLFALAPEIVSNVYGERWLGMVPILSILIFYGLIKSFEFVVSPLFLGVGKPKTSAVSLFSQFAVMLILIVPFTAKFGAPGTAFAVLLGSIVAQGILLFAVRREIGFGFRGLADIAWLPFLSAFLMYTAIAGTKSVFPILGVSGLFFFVLYGAGVYVVVLFSLDFLFGKNMYNSFLWIKKNI